MSKLTYGIGFNLQGKYAPYVSRRATEAYVVWRDMMKRCYSSKYHKGKPTYINCEVDAIWHNFQNFAEWYYNHEYSDMGYQLDKDILAAENNVYSPETCCFVPREINMLIVDYSRARGIYPQGVYLHKASGNYMSSIRASGERVHLGCFDCPNKAHQVYKIAKEAYVKEKALEWQDRIACNVFEALMNWELS